MFRKKHILFWIAFLSTSILQAVVLEVKIDVKDQNSPENEISLSSAVHSEFDNVVHFSVMNNESKGFAIDIIPSENTEDKDWVDFQCKVIEDSQFLFTPNFKTALGQEAELFVGDDLRAITVSILPKK